MFDLHDDSCLLFYNSVTKVHIIRFIYLVILSKEENYHTILHYSILTVFCMRRKKRYLLPGDVKAKIHLFLPTILYILTIHLYFLPFAHFLLFTLHFLFLFVLQSKDFIVFCRKIKRPIKWKETKRHSTPYYIYQESSVFGCCLCRHSAASN